MLINYPHTAITNRPPVTDSPSIAGASNTRSFIGLRGAWLTLAGLVGLLFLALPGHANLDDLAITEVPTATGQQSRKVRLINYLIDESHYRKKKLDDSLSAEILDAYLARLDPAKDVFMQSDVDKFQMLRHQFDDFIGRGTLQPAFTMFSILRTRINERVIYALARLDQPFDFELNETYQLDRKQASWVSNKKQLDDLWRKRIKNDFLTLRLSDKEDDEIITTLKNRYTHLARRTRQFNSADVFQTFINSYLGIIDPHTSYFPPRASENFNIQMRLSLDGIGAILQTDNQYTKVRRIIPGGPADLGQQLKADDRVVGVAQGELSMVDIIGWRLDDVVELIRGPKESIVRLEVLPAESAVDSSPKVISIRRDKINLEEQAAKKRILSIQTERGEARIGVIDLPSFYSDFSGMNQKQSDYRSTTRDVRKLLAELSSEQIDGLVIDLRNNGGGALTEAVNLTGLFIKKGPVVQTRNVSGRVHINRDPDPNLIYSGPLAVLVNRYSASASEIFAGAIQDYQRGLVIGEDTFGKGTVQHLIDLNHFAKDDGALGQLKLTIAQFFRINGDSTQYRGVVPDIAWQTAGASDEFGERANDHALPWRKIAPAIFQPSRPINHVTAAIMQVRDWHQQRIPNDPQFQHFTDLQAISRQLREQLFVPLNEDTRTQQRHTRDQQRLDLENRMRQAQGKDILVSIEALEEQRKEQTAAIEKNRMEQEPDALLREASNILSDYSYAMRALQSGEAANQPPQKKTKTERLVGK